MARLWTLKKKRKKKKNINKQTKEYKHTTKKTIYLPRCLTKCRGVMYMGLVFTSKLKRRVK